MRALITGKNSKNIAGLVKQFGLEIVKSKPDLIISYGGDGTLLSAERQYPGVPKLPIRNNQFCHKCPNHEDKILIQSLLEHKLQLKEFKKLHTNYHGKNLLALNDFVIRNKQPVHAIRFNVFVNGNQKGALLVGDGIVVATPFGSTGYFKSITQKSFDQGFSIAFNNTTKELPPLYLDEGSNAGFKLVRGKATLTFDNSPEIFHIPEGTILNFTVSNQVAKIYSLETLRCPNCQVQR